MRATPRVVPVILLAAVLTGASPSRLSAQWTSDEWLETPVDVGTFESWLPFFAYDETVPFALEARAVEDDGGIRIERIAFTSTPGETVTADIYTVPAAPKGRPHLIVVHGGVRSGRASVAPVAELLVRRGFDVISIDLPYFGDRDTGFLGSFSEAAKHEALYNRPSTYLAWVTQVVKDVGRTIDLLVDHYGADPDRIGYFGFSRGAQVGFIVAGVETRLRAVALLYGGHFDRGETGHLAAACPANYIGRIAPRPLWILNGSFDGDYDREKSVEPLLGHAGQPTEISWVETGHQLPRPEDLERLAEWMAPRLD